jgi:hypothetical protein
LYFSRKSPPSTVTETRQRRQQGVRKTILTGVISGLIVWAITSKITAANRTESKTGYWA